MHEDGLADLGADARAGEVDRLELATTVGALEHAAVEDEPYDALDAEDVGAAWLRRATQAGGPGERDVDELFDGSHVIEPRVGGEDNAPPSSAYGADQEGQPLAPNAGTHEEDVATELPVSEEELARRTRHR